MVPLEVDQRRGIGYLGVCLGFRFVPFFFLLRKQKTELTIMIIIVNK